MKIKLKSSLLSGICSLLLFCSCFRVGLLTDITKPHVGMYECVEAKLGGEEYLSRFSYIQLELKGEGDFILYYQEKGGEQKQETGKYEYDRENKKLTLCANEQPIFKRGFPLENGVLIISFSIGGQNFSLKFEQK